MGQLRIDLQEGFAGDTVIVLLDGKELFQEANLRTRLQIGLAKSIAAEADQALANIEIRLVEREVSAAFVVDTSQPAFVGVSVEPGGGLAHRVSREPFGYV